MNRKLGNIKDMIVFIVFEKKAKVFNKLFIRNGQNELKFKAY